MVVLPVFLATTKGPRQKYKRCAVAHSKDVSTDVHFAPHLPLQRGLPVKVLDGIAVGDD